MSVFIEKDKCIGCKKCVEVCPGNLFVVRGKKAEIRDERDCWGCTACVKECPQNAISYYLAADLGGGGSLLYATEDETSINWVLQSPEGKETTVTVNKNQSNEY